MHADTDGDGAFDYVARDYDTFPDANEVQSDIPNNVTVPGGSITVRHVTGWPYKTTAVCGEATQQGPESTGSAHYLTLYRWPGL